MSSQSADIELLKTALLSPAALGTIVVGLILVIIFVSPYESIGRIILIRRQHEAYKTNFPRIEGIPEVGNAIPFLGNLHILGGRQGKNDATVYTEWGSNLNAEMYQCVMGDQRTVIVSSWQIMKDLWINHSNALIDRPHQPGFVDQLGVDLTGMPMTDQIRKCRQAGMRALAKVRTWALIA